MSTTLRVIPERGSDTPKSYSGLMLRKSSMSRRDHYVDIACHSSLAHRYLHITWKSSSRTPFVSLYSHRRHILVGSRLLENLFDQVAREFDTTRHAETRSLEGAGHLHMVFQMARRPSGTMLVHGKAMCRTDDEDVGIFCGPGEDILMRMMASMSTDGKCW